VLKASLAGASAAQEVGSESVVGNRHFLTQQVRSKTHSENGLENAVFGAVGIGREVFRKTVVAVAELLKRQANSAS
jgi:hypothetical protein